MMPKSLQFHFIIRQTPIEDVQLTPTPAARLDDTSHQHTKVFSVRSTLRTQYLLHADIRNLKRTAAIYFMRARVRAPESRDRSLHSSNKQMSQDTLLPSLFPIPLLANLPSTIIDTVPLLTLLKQLSTQYAVRLFYLLTHPDSGSRGRRAGDGRDPGVARRVSNPPPLNLLCDL